MVTMAVLAPLASTSMARGLSIAMADMNDPFSIPSARYTDKADGWSGAG
jgi:hypothetical protein